MSDFISYKNVLFVRNILKRENPQVFHQMFIILNQKHTYNTRAATYNFLDIWTIFGQYGQYSIKFQASETWNKLQRTQNLNLLTSAPSEFKKALFEEYPTNTAITPRRVYYSLYIAIFLFYFTLFFSCP